MGLGAAACSAPDDELEADALGDEPVWDVTTDATTEPDALGWGPGASRWEQPPIAAANAKPLRRQKNRARTRAQPSSCLRAHTARIVVGVGQMHALVKGALAAGALSVAGVLLSRAYPGKPAITVSATAPAPSASALPPPLAQMPCPPRHLPEGEACVPLLALDQPLIASDFEVQRERRARSTSFDVIPRKPDRPSDPTVFRYPLEGKPLFLRGFEQADSAHTASPVSLEMAAERGTPVRVLGLDDQEGNAQVVGVGRFIGTTVVTRHVVLGATRPRVFLLVHGHLEAVAADTRVGVELNAGSVLGFVGDSGNPGIVSLYLEARLVREGVDVAGLPIERLLDVSVSVPTDARNALPMD